MPRLLLLIGLPGSGKSTLAAQLLQDCPSRLLISTDAIRSQLFGDAQIQGDWLLVWREVGRQLRDAAYAIQMGTATEAIYDATNVVRKQRRQAIALIREAGFTQITGLWLNTPLRMCMQRNQARDRQVPQAVIERMYRRLWGAPPATQEGLEELIELSPSHPLILPLHPRPSIKTFC
jgi:predicted kinase